MNASVTATRPVTSLEVALRAGVSQSAVSRTFSPGGVVSKNTSEKVQRAARELGYRPNAIARSLSTRSSRIVGIVLSFLDNQFYPPVVEELSRALQRHGLHSMLFFADHDNADSAFSQIIAYQLDGVVLASATLSSGLAQQCAALGIPVVLFNRSTEDAQSSSVTSDNVRAGRLAGDFLLDGGHQRIGYIAGRNDASTNRDRERGLLEALAARGQTLFAHGIGNFEQAAAVNALNAMFATGQPRPDAIVVASDHMAFAVIDALRLQHGLQVPEEISLVSFDNVPQAAWPAYNLTTVMQSVPAMVAATVELLVAKAAAAPTERRIVVDCTLVVRGSARLPKEGS